jgi:hypothetical protein
MGANGILRRYVLEHERPRVLVKSHEGIAEGHYAEKRYRVEGIAHMTMVVEYSDRLEGVLPEIRCLSEGW